MPEWREYPDALIEAVFYVSEGDGTEVPGKCRFKYGPTGEPSGQHIVCKGDFAPIFDSAVVGTEVFLDVVSVLNRVIPTEEHEPGTILLRFYARSLENGWKLDFYDEDVQALISFQMFRTFARDDPDPDRDEPDDVRVQHPNELFGC